MRIKILRALKILFLSRSVKFRKRRMNHGRCKEGHSFLKFSFCASVYGTCKKNGGTPFCSTWRDRCQGNDVLVPRNHSWNPDSRERPHFRYCA